MIDRAAIEPRCTYDPEADALGIEIVTRATTAKQVVVGPGIRLDMDGTGRPIFLEILGASAFFLQRVLRRFDRPTSPLSLREAAAEAGMPVTALRSEIDAGRLPAEKRGRRWIVEGADLFNYLERREAARVAGGSRPARSRKASATAAG